MVILDAEMKNKQDSISILTGKIDNLNKELKNMEEDKGTLEKQINDVKDQLSKLNIDKDYMTKSYNSTLAQIKTQELILSGVVDTILLKENKVISLDNEITEKQSEIVKIKDKLVEYAKDEKDLIENIGKLKSEYEEIKKNVSDDNRKRFELQNRSVELDKRELFIKAKFEEAWVPYM